MNAFLGLGGGCSSAVPIGMMAMTARFCGIFRICLTFCSLNAPIQHVP